MHGSCLLGEMPFFAVNIPNPRAALVVLECFTQLAGIELDLSDLREQAATVEQELGQLVEQMNQAIAQAAEQAEQESEEAATEMGPEPAPQPPREPQLDPKVKRRIESMFEQARQDRSKAYELKQELDRLGVFKQYENRFLDLFRRAE